MGETPFILEERWKNILTSYQSEHLTEERLTVRLEGEAEAKKLLEEKLGNFEQTDIEGFLKYLNRDWSNGKLRINRFMPAFYGHLANQIISSHEAFNQWSKELWMVDDLEVNSVLDNFWEKNEIAGAGTSLPSAILYLKNPDKYSIWLPVIEQGLKRVCKIKLKKRRTSEGYNFYNLHIQELKNQLSLKSQAIDIVLTLAARIATDENQFEDLFQEFIESYLETTEGQNHLARYPIIRDEGLKNYDAIQSLPIESKGFTDTVLLKLLPHADTEHNRNAGAWVHVAPAINKDIKQWYEGAGWTKSDDWPAVAKALVEFIKNCISEPDNLESHCKWFSANCPSQGFQMGLVTPILNALDPKNFSLINNKPRQVLIYLNRTKYGNNIVEYPKINSDLFSFLSSHQDDFSEIADIKTQHGDLFDLFSHWMVAVKKFDFKQSSIYKIAPGEGAWNWETCRDNGYIAIGWDELGDLAGLSKNQFEERRDDLLKSHKDWTKKGVNQVWTFANIKEGDRIVANKGKKEILGIGTVTGSYYFVENAKLGHRLPVMWDDLTQRAVEEPSWSGTLQKISRTRFDQLKQALPIGEIAEKKVGINIIYSLESCSEETGFHVSELERWVAAIKRKGQAILYGPPGTGKTYLALRLSTHLIGGGSGIQQIVQFHPEYSYQEFIQGIRPLTREGSLRYEMIPGVFLKFCEETRNLQGNSVLIIDEINRANLSRVFGELMYLLEYRDEAIELPGGGQLKIPSNTYIIGTMNTADRSIALVDYALRRRFSFIRIDPNIQVLDNYHKKTGFDTTGLKTLLQQVNAEISDPNYEIGISFFLSENIEDDIEDIWQLEIEPYLEEYFFDSPEKVQKYRWNNISKHFE